MRIECRLGWDALSCPRIPKTGLATTVARSAASWTRVVEPGKIGISDDGECSEELAQPARRPGPAHALVSLLAARCCRCRCRANRQDVPCSFVPCGIR